MSRLFWAVAAAMSELYKLTSRAFSGFAPFNDEAWVELTVRSDGQLRAQYTNSPMTSPAPIATVTPDGEWTSDESVNGNLFEVMFELEETVAGGNWTGTFDSWLQLSANRSVRVSTTGANYREGIVTVTIREIATSDVVATAAFILGVESVV